MRYVILAVFLLFEPIIIDEQTFNQIVQTAHASMRGTEYDVLMAMLNNLEQRAVQSKAMQPKK